MLKHNFGLRIKWLGCACFEMDFGGVTVVNDPWITPNPSTQLTWEAVEKCDYITLSHGHYDHITDIPELVKKFDPYVICGENTAMPLMKWTDLNPTKVFPVCPDLELDTDAVKIKALYGRHNLRPSGWNQLDKVWQSHEMTEGDPNLVELNKWGDFEYRNFLFTSPNGVKTLMWGTPLDHPIQRNILIVQKADIVMMMSTKRYPAADTAEFLSKTGCKTVIVHHIDFPRDKTEFVNLLKYELEKRAPEIQFIVPKYGEWMEL